MSDGPSKIVYSFCIGFTSVIIMEGNPIELERMKKILPVLYEYIEYIPPMIIFGAKSIPDYTFLKSSENPFGRVPALALGHHWIDEDATDLKLIQVLDKIIFDVFRLRVPIKAQGST